MYVYLHKLKNKRGCIDYLWLWVSHLSTRQTELSVYLALLPQHWALYAKVDSTPTFMYIYILRHLLEILNMDRNIKTMHCKRFESFCSSMKSKKTHLIFCFIYQCLVQIQKNSLCLLAHVEKLLLYLKVNSFWETFVDV